MKIEVTDGVVYATAETMKDVQLLMSYVPKPIHTGGVKKGTKRALYKKKIVPGAPTPRREEMWKMVKSGAKVKDVAQFFGVSNARIYQIITENQKQNRTDLQAENNNHKDKPFEPAGEIIPEDLRVQ